MRLSRLFWRPWSQEKAIANARQAATELSQARVTREAVDLLLARQAAARGGPAGLLAAERGDERRPGEALAYRTAPGRTRPRNGAQTLGVVLTPHP